MRPLGFLKFQSFLRFYAKRARRNPTNNARGTARRSHGRDGARNANAAPVKKTPIRKATGASNTPRNTPSGFTRRPARRLDKSHSRRESLEATAVDLTCASLKEV